MANLDEYIGVEHCAAGLLYSAWPAVVVHEILSDPCTLSLPVKPYALDTVVDMVASYSNVYGSMELDSCCFSSAQLLRCADIMNVAVLNC